MVVTAVQKTMKAGNPAFNLAIASRGYLLTSSNAGDSGGARHGDGGGSPSIGGGASPSGGVCPSHVGPSHGVGPSLDRVLGPSALLPA